MEFVVINGSPQGAQSVTIQYLRYIEKRQEKHSFVFFHVAQQIRLIEKKKEKLDEIINSVERADGVIWAFPLYYMMVPSQLKKFIEIVEEKNYQQYFKDKYTFSLSTSVHFFDHTAHIYIHGICDDWGMRFFDEYSPDTYDLFSKTKRQNWLSFFEMFVKIIEGEFECPKKYLPLSYSNKKYIYSKEDVDKNVADRLNQIIRSCKDEKISPKIVILTEKFDENTNLGQMIKSFCDNLAYEIDYGIGLPSSGRIRLIQSSDIHMKGPCLGCMHCSYDNICRWELSNSVKQPEKNDNFKVVWNECVKEADIIVYGGEIKDRYLTSWWKQMFDRAYVNNHTPIYKNKQVLWLISGPFQQLNYLNEILSSWIEFQGSTPVALISDDLYQGKDLTYAISYSILRAYWNWYNNYQTPKKFFAVASKKMFRDEVYGRLRFVCQADHRNYKKNGFYASFPQNDKRSKSLNRKLMFLTKFSKFRKWFYDNVDKEFVKPFLKLVDNLDK